MTMKVLDSWAIMAFFKGEPSAEAVESLMQRASADKIRLLLSVVNWGEIYYSFWRAGGRSAAETISEEMSRLPLELVEINLALAKQAAIFKAGNRMSYADCFAAALAKEENCELLTGDAEFKEVESQIKIGWLK